jgi:hypothetical protein
LSLLSAKSNPEVSFVWPHILGCKEREEEERERERERLSQYEILHIYLDSFFNQFIFEASLENYDGTRQQQLTGWEASTCTPHTYSVSSLIYINCPGPTGI